MRLAGRGWRNGRTHLGPERLQRVGLRERVSLPRGATGGEVGYLTEVFNHMVTRLRTSRSDLERLSVTDPLTGLGNRASDVATDQILDAPPPQLPRPFSHPE